MDPKTYETVTLQENLLARCQRLSRRKSCRGGSLRRGQGGPGRIARIRQFKGDGVA